MTKLSYKYADFASTVVPLKDGRLLEVRRGPLTGKAIPDRRTWASEEEWRATLPSADATLRCLYDLLANFCEADDVCAPLNTLLDYVMGPEGRAALDRDAHAMRSVQSYTYEINGNVLATTALRRKALDFLRTTDFNYRRLYDGGCGNCPDCSRKSRFLRPLTQEEEDTIIVSLREVIGASDVQLTVLIDTTRGINPADTPQFTPEQEAIVKKLNKVVGQMKDMPYFRVVYGFPPPAAPKLEVEELSAPKLEVEEVAATIVPEIVIVTAETFLANLGRLVDKMERTIESVHALADILNAAPPSLRDHVRRSHYILAAIRYCMYANDTKEYAQTVLRTYTPLF
jgi:hypothetical protein